MSVIIGNSIPLYKLALYVDANNPRCLSNPDSAVSSSTRLNNLAGGLNNGHTAKISHLYPSGNSTGHANMSFPSFNGRRVCFQSAYAAGTGADPGWYGSMTSSSRVSDYTFSSWFRYKRGSSEQIAENIYGGGFQSQTSFYMCWGGTADAAGVLHYSPGSVQNFSHGYSNGSLVDGSTAPGTNGPGGSTHNWHHHLYTTRYGGSAGTWESWFYVDGQLIHYSDNQDVYVPWTSGTMTWGSWSGGYGNYTGYMNHYMYYERHLNAGEVNQIYQAQRGFYNV